MGTHLWSTSLWLVLLAAVATNSVAGSGVCPQSCPKSSSVLHYQEGQKYTYNLEGTTITTLPGTQGDVSKLQLKATVEVGVKSTCSHVIRVKNLQITGPDDKKYSPKELEGHPVVANVQGGLINDQLCTVQDENQASLNIKRAILSLLQTTTHSATSSSTIREVDIFGICPSQISYSRSGDSTIIKKSRNLNQCAHREDLKQEYLSTPFVGNADLQSIPLLESTLNVVQTIKKGIIVSAESHESYLFRPFAKQSAGVRTTVETKLTLTSEKAQAPTIPDTVNIPRSIIFDPVHESSHKSNKQSIIAALNAARESMPDSAGPEAARRFQALVGVLRQSSKDDILSVYREVKAGAGFSNSHAARKVLLDALYRTGTGDSIGVAVELIRNNEIPSEYSGLWYSSFAFVRHASLSSITAVSSLLDDTNLPREALLGIGSLAGRYCREHNCENVQQVNELISKLSKRLNTNIATREDENKVIGALKALHNIHHLNNAVADVLQKIASDHSIPIRVRVAALDTYHSDACRPKLKKSALEILNNREEDSEIRIKAYLVLVECPCGTVANNLKELLENEPSNQVGSYIVSHLRNLRSSANPSKANAKHHLGLLRSRKHYPQDIRKYSQNYELSYILDALNIGTTVESNVIFSQSSYVPRSVSLNLTTDLFGHSYNILELETRTENADTLLESFLGPKGYFNTKELDEVLESIIEIIDKYGGQIVERLQKVVRHKRSIKQEDIDRIRNEVIKSLPPSHGKELIVDLSVKLFGSELAWLTCDHDTEHLSPERIIDRIFDLLDGAIDKAKKFSHRLHQHWTFLDTQLTYPTGVGFPLQLVASGSTAVHLVYSGQIDIPALLHDPKNAALQLEIIPSAAVEVTGELLINAQVVEAGLKAAYTLHTSTGANVGIKILDGTGVDITFGLPVKKQDIITLKTEVLKTVHEAGHPEVDTPLAFIIPQKEYEGCFDQLTEILGITVCGKFSVPHDTLNNPTAFYPLNGPSLLSLHVEATDVNVYHLKGHLNNKDPKHQALELLIETPNTKSQRKLALHVEANSEPNAEIKIRLISPWKTVGVQGILVDESSEQSITGKVLNDETEYSAKIGVKVSGDPNHQTYTPILEYKYPDERSTKKGGSSQAYNVRGSVTVDRNGNNRKYNFNKVSLTCPHGHYEVDGTLSKETNLYSADLKLSSSDSYLILKTKLQKVEQDHYKASLDVIPSKQKDLSIGLRWEYERKNNLLRNELVITHGQDLHSDQSRITLSQSLHYTINSASNFDISTHNSLTYPNLNINVKLDGEATPKNIDYNLLISYDVYKVASELHAKTGVKKVGDYNINFVAEILNNTLKIVSSRDIIGEGKSKFVNVLELIPVAKYELEAIVTHQSKPNDLNHQIDAVLKIDGQPHEYKADIGLILNRHLTNAHTKLSVGSDNIVNIAVLVKNENDNYVGDFKLYIKKHITAESHYNYNRAGGKGTLLIDIPNIKRKINGNVELVISGTTYTGDATLQWNADVDPKQQLSIHTANDIREESIESKNILTILDQKTVWNVKGVRNGKLTDGQILVSTDITLPNGRHLTLKFDRNLQIKAVSQGRVELVLEDSVNKNSQPRKLHIEIGAKNVDSEISSFDSDGKLEYITPEGKNIQIFVKAANTPHGEQDKIEGELHIDGSLIYKPVQLQLSSDISEQVITYKANGKFGSDTTGSISGKVHTGLGGESTREIDNTIEINLPDETIKHIKLANTLSILVQNDGPIEVKTNNLVSWNNDNTVKVDAHLSGQVTQGTAKIIISVPKQQPCSVAITWSAPKGVGNEVKRAGSLALHWDGDKEAKVNGEITWHKGDDKYFALKLDANTPNEKLKHLELSTSSQVTASHLESNGVLTVNDRKTTWEGKISLHGAAPLVDIVITLPEGTSKLYINPEQITQDHIKGQLIWQCAVLDGKFEADVDIVLNIDNPKLHVELDAPKLKIDKWLIEAHQNVVKGVKKVVFSVKSQNKGIISGSTTLRHKTDGNSETYDGAGIYKIGDQGDQRFNYRFDRIEINENNRKGIELKLSIDAGQKTIRSSLKSTNQDQSLSAKYCSKATCSSFDAGTVLDSERAAYDIVIDMQHLEVPVKLVVREGASRNELEVKYEYDFVLEYDKHQHAHGARFIATDKGTVFNLTLPHRVISFETTTNVKLEGSEGQQEASIQLWWDRVNKPSLRTVASITLNQKNDKNGLQLSSQARFNNPSLERELGINGYLLIGGPNTLVDSSLDIDIFKKANQKISITSSVVQKSISEGYNISGNVHIKSKGQNIDILISEYLAASSSQISAGSLTTYKAGKQTTAKDFAATLDITKDSLNVLVKLPNSEILRVEGTANIDDHLPIDMNLEISVIGQAPTVIHTSIQKKGVVSLTTTVYRKGTPTKKLILTGGIDNGVHLRAEVLKQSERKELAHISVSGKEEDFLKTDLSYSSENIQGLIGAIRHGIEEDLKKTKDVLINFINQLKEEIIEVLEILKKSQPNVQRLLDVAQQQWKAIETEINNDEVLKAISQNIVDRTGALMKTIDEALKTIASTINNLLHAILELENATVEYLKKISPDISKAWASIVNSTIGIIEIILNEISVILSHLAQFLKTHEAEIKHLITSISELIHDISQVSSSSIQKVLNEIIDFSNIFIDEVKRLPVYSILREKYEELEDLLSKVEIPSEVWNLVKEIVELLKGFLPNDELKDLVNTIENYIEKHVKKEKVDDEAELEKIYEKLIIAIKSILKLVDKNLSLDEQSTGLLGYKSPISLTTLVQLPRILIVRLSPLAYLASDDLPQLLDLYYTYKPTWNPFDWIPPYSATGILVESNNFLTYDRRHYTFKGSCSYVLAEDYLDGNFSLVVILESGKLKSIILSDRSNTIELGADKSLKVNGAAKDYPAGEGDIEAIRNYHSVNLNSKAGVYVHCHTSFDVCAFHISGFYHGRVRGLLGTINNEEYDDYSLPNGKIASQPGEFANAWKVDSQCADIPVTTIPSHSSVKECADIFSGQSSLSTCYPVINPSVFRDSCNEATSLADNKIETACAYAEAYIVLCDPQTALPTILPAACKKISSSQCSAADGSKYAPDEIFTVKTPQKAADVVIVVEQVHDNARIFKDLITPLVSTLNGDLKKKGITDVKYALIGYGAPDQDEAVLITNDGEIGFGTKNIKFPAPEPKENATSEEDSIPECFKWLEQKLDDAVHHLNQIEAFAMAIDYPFRAGAAKAIVGVIATPCPQTGALSQLRIKLSKKLYPYLGIKLHIVTPVEDLHIQSKEQGKATAVVGFDSDAVYTLDKKKAEGDTILRDSLEYKSNICVDITQASQGVVYNSNYYTTAKPSEKKQYLNVVSSRIASSLTSSELTESCLCVLEDGLHPQSSCHVTAQREKEATAQQKKGVKG